MSVPSAVLASVVGATVVSTVFSLSLAATLSFRWLSGLVDRLVHVSIGLLLATAWLHLVPEALAGAMTPKALGWTVLSGIFALFTLEKLTLLHHTHHHEGDGHHHEHGHDAAQMGKGVLPVLVADTFHNFTDGIVIAAAFLVDTRSGIMAALAVAAHEVPHEVGDFMILLNAGVSRRRAVLFLLSAGLASVLGGVLGFFLLANAQSLLPYALAVAAASFMYIALSDLLPELMRRSSIAQSLPELLYVAGGVALALLAMQLQ
jgi:zinc and cadmium transporter